MKQLLLPFLLLAVPCLAPPVFAAPHDVSITLKREDGKPLPPKMTFYVIDEKGAVVSGSANAGVATVRLPEGRYSLWLSSDRKLRVPGKLWHGLEIAADTAKWDLTMPPFASLQGKILRADGKPATHCAIQVQSGTNTSTPAFYWPSTPAQWAQLAAGAQTAYAATSTAADGTFTLVGLVPGNYALDVFDGDARKWFTIPFTPALKFDAASNVPTKIGTWTAPQNAWDWLLDAKLKRAAGPTKFDGQGEMKMENRVLHLGIGKDLTGVTWSDTTLPRENYEIALDARRVDGGDFFCGLTFPVGEKPLSWIVGGWGGTVVGLSNINGYSADENESTQTRDFDLNRWYRLRLRVSKPKIEAWINDDKVIDLPIHDKEFSVRYSVEPSRPLGIATWRTAGEARDVRIRRLDAAEVTAIEKTVDQP